jgi:hypothetical protein
VHDSQGQAQTQVQGPGVKPLPALRPAQRIFEEIPALSHLLPESGPRRRDPGRYKIKLVNLVESRAAVSTVAAGMANHLPAAQVETAARDSTRS